VAEIALNRRLRDWEISKDELAQGIGLSRSAVSLICNRDRWPAKRPALLLQKDIEHWLRERLGQDDIHPTEREIKGLWKEVAASRQSKDQPEAEASDQSEEIEVLPKKERLSPEAMKHFRLFTSPFGDVDKDEQMYLGPEYRQHRERILSVMRSGGMLAIVGQSGSGKTTLFEDCEEYARAHYPNVVLIKPPIIGRAETKEKGSPLRAAELMRLIVTHIDEDARPKHKLFDLYKQLTDMLSARPDQQFCLYVDDAHRVSDLTVFRDFYNIKAGRKRLLSIVMFGQLRLGNRLDVYNPDAVHVTQHCEVVYLRPLNEDGLRAYLNVRFAAAGADVTKVLAEDTYKAIIEKLSRLEKDAGRTPVRIGQAYPLAVGNVLTLAMNACVDPDLPSELVTAEIIGEV
jgi:type II secretory pathway predicted ATPase ExeA